MTHPCAKSPKPTCPKCGEPNPIIPNYTGDRSACPACLRKAQRREKAERIIEFVRKNL